MKTNKDYQDELKQALIELDNSNIKPKVKREDDFLNVILGVLIVAIVVVGIAGAVLIGKTYVNLEPKDPIVNNDLNNNDDHINNELDENNQENVDINNDQDLGNNFDVQDEIIDIKNEENSNFEVLELKISKEGSKVRFDIQSKTKIKGNIFLKDDKTLSIGPIAIHEGTNHLYFLINGLNNYSLQFDANDGQTYIYEISNEQIVNALKE